MYYICYALRNFLTPLLVQYISIKYILKNKLLIKNSGLKID